MVQPEAAAVIDSEVLYIKDNIKFFVIFFVYHYKWLVNLPVFLNKHPDQTVLKTFTFGKLNLCKNWKSGLGGGVKMGTMRRN